MTDSLSCKTCALVKCNALEEIEKRDNEIEELRHLGKIYKEQIAELRAEVNQYKNDIDITEAALGISGLYATKDKQIATLKAEIQRLNSTTFTLQKITDLKAEVERLREALSTLAEWRR